MSHQEENFEAPEEEMGNMSNPFQIPMPIKLLVTAVALLMIGLCSYLLIIYLDAPSTYASPNDLGLTTIFLFSITSLFVAWLPWQRLGIRITKIGGIEFKQIVQEQASEHAEEISYLQDRIETLEANFRLTNEMGGFTESFQEPDLRILLTKFLEKYKQWAFSPSRIRAWGSQQQGFSKLSNYDHPFLRNTLQKMVSEGMLETRISKKGNTLFRASMP